MADEQISKDERVKLSRRQEVDDLKFIMSSKEGRRFIWRLLTHCGVYRSIWSNSAAIHYNSGMQDVGHFVQAEVIDAAEGSYLQMIKESKENNA